MSEHTKGPWKLRGNNIGVSDVSETQSYGMLINIAYVDEFDLASDWQANAKLIASAPDMHDEITRLLAVEAAAKKLDEALEWVMKDYEDMCRKSLQQSANWKKRLVMAKASSNAFQRSINPIGDEHD